MLVKRETGHVRDGQDRHLVKQRSPNDLLNRAVRVQVDGRRRYCPRVSTQSSRTSFTYLRRERAPWTSTTHSQRTLTPGPNSAHLSQQRPCKAQQLPLSSRQRRSALLNRGIETPVEALDVRLQMSLTITSTQGLSSDETADGYTIGIDYTHVRVRPRYPHLGTRLRDRCSPGGYLRINLDSEGQSRSPIALSTSTTEDQCRVLKYCQVDVRSCSPIVLMSTPSIKIFPEAASMMRNSARSSCHTRIRKRKEPMRKHSPTTFQRLSFQQYRSSPLVSI